MSIVDFCDHKTLARNIRHKLNNVYFKVQNLKTS
jgi:hypothetical protein